MPANQYLGIEFGKSNLGFLLVMVVVLAFDLATERFLGLVFAVAFRFVLRLGFETVIEALLKVAVAINLPFGWNIRHLGNVPPTHHYKRDCKI